MEIYTDGGCIENPGGIGAWAFVVVADGQVIHKASGAELETTNNRTELMGIIMACEWANQNRHGFPITIRTDSDLCVKCGDRIWKRKSNLDLWVRFNYARKDHHSLKWIKGHSGDRWNDMADAMCKSEMRALYGWRETRSLAA